MKPTNGFYRIAKSVWAYLGLRLTIGLIASMSALLVFGAPIAVIILTASVVALLLVARRRTMVIEWLAAVVGTGLVLWALKMIATLRT